jgi:hypothetical protein
MAETRNENIRKPSQKCVRPLLRLHSEKSNNKRIKAGVILLDKVTNEEL